MELKQLIFFFKGEENIALKQSPTTGIVLLML